MNNGTKWFLLGALIASIVCVTLSYKCCGDRDDEILRLKAEIADQKDVIVEKEASYNKLRDDTEAMVAELNGMIDSSNTVIARKDEEIATQDERLAELREANKVLTNKDEIIENLKEQVFILDKKFTLAQAQLSLKDNVIFALNEKYKVEYKLRLESEALCEGLRVQVKKQILLIDALEMKLAYQKRVSLYQKIGFGALGLLLGVIAE